MKIFFRRFAPAWVVALLLLGLGPGARAEDLISVAIYPLKATGVEETLASALTSILGSELSQCPRIKLIQESYVKTVMERQAVNLSDMYDSTQFQVDLGRLVAAQKVLVGEVSLLAGKFQMTLNLIDVERGTTDFAQTELCPCTEEQLGNLVREMAGKIRAHFGEELPPAASPSAPPVPTEPVEALSPVSLLDKSLKKKILVEAERAARTTTGTVQVTLVVKNKSKAPITLQARTQFFDQNRIPAENAAAWQRIFVLPASRATYTETSTKHNLKFYQVEVRVAR